MNIKLVESTTKLSQMESSHTQRIDGFNKEIYSLQSKCNDLQVDKQSLENRCNDLQQDKKNLEKLLFKTLL